MTQPENLYPGPEGQVSPAEPLMPPTSQPQAYGQPIAPAVQAYQQPPPYPGQPMAPASATYQPPMANQQPIVVNQAIPQAPLKLKTMPASIVCPHCHNNVTTVVDTQFNCLNCCFCWFFCICWCCVNLINDKDFNCTDATHKCPQCGQVVFQYNAC